jgi:Flp pilus assembly protein TadG
MQQRVNARRQHGAVLITVALMTMLLLGFMGIAMDLGRLFIVKSELQTAMDACALAAAQELDLQADAITRARSAGLTAGNLNRVNLQSANWSGQGQLTETEITFKDTAYVDTELPGVAQYAQCEHRQESVQTWLMHVAAAALGNTTDIPSTNNVLARAVATRAHGQTTCPIPVTLKPKGGGTAPDYGFTPGEWVTLLTTQSATPGGYIGWANLDGSNDANETRAEMNGKCGTRVNDVLGTPGTQTTIAEPWNYRFGIYKKLPDFSIDPDYMRPDLSGYAYSATNWPSQRNAYNGTDAAAGPTAANFVSKRASFGACAPDGTVKSCESITGASLNSFKDLAATGTGTASHGAWGTNRRIVTVPVTDSANKVVDFACMLMLQPLSIPMKNVQLEYIGNASRQDSPCSFSGMPGGVAGPLVPALVR